jgi:TrmH family RNA methyltransferase
MFLIEGSRELFRAMESNVSIETIFVCEKFFKGDTQQNLIAIAQTKQIQLCELRDDVFEKISNRENCDGVIGLANFWTTEFTDIKLSKNALLLIAEKIEKAGNLGALMRSAESAGVDALILCNPVTDIFNPNVVRASQGAVFSLTIVSSDNKQTLQFLKKHSINIFALTPSATNIYFDENFQSRTAIIVGAEHDGLSDFWLKNDDIKKISLPQLGVCDSLNVNDAAAIVLYEALRQRITISSEGNDLLLQMGKTL